MKYVISKDISIFFNFKWKIYFLIGFVLFYGVIIFEGIVNIKFMVMRILMDLIVVDLNFFW